MSTPYLYAINLSKGLETAIVTGCDKSDRDTAALNIAAQKALAQEAQVLSVEELYPILDHSNPYLTMNQVAASLNYGSPNSMGHLLGKGIPVSKVKGGPRIVVRELLNKKLQNAA